MVNDPEIPEELEPRDGTSSQPMIKLTWIGVFLFCLLYFFRPEDFYAPLVYIPFGKITGIFAAIAFVSALVLGGAKLRTEAKLMLLLLGYLILCVPFSRWRGGSVDLIFNVFAKTLLIAIACTVCVTTTKRLQKLMLVQILAMLFLSVMAFRQGKTDGRMYGVGNLFGDANDFALSLCVVLPLCFAMMLAAKNFIKKVFWIGIIGTFLLAIVYSGSRGGFLALLTVTFVITKKFSKGFGSAIAMMLMILVLGGAAIISAGPSAFFERMSTILSPSKDPNGSAQARKELLLKSLEYSAEHPIFGIGPGQFQNLQGLWHQTHNTYTQFSAEAGIPTLVIFILLLRRTFKNLKSAQFPAGSREEYLSKAIYCSMFAYMVGAFFLSTGYLFYPYLLMAYASSVAQISEAQGVPETVSPAPEEEPSEAVINTWGEA